VSDRDIEQRALDDLLSSFREAGQMDSQGSFTMAGRKAAGKLAQSLLPEPADWILKVVQGACRAQAPALSISQTRRATHVEFQLPYLLDIQAFEASLTQGSTSYQSGIDELSTALRVLGLGQQRSWVARLRGAETTTWVLVKDGEASLETVAERAGETGVTEVLIGIAFPPGQTGKVGGLVRFGAAVQHEHEALSVRARACPIPLLLDGERLDTLQRESTLESFEHEAFLGVAFGQEPQLAPLAPPGGLQESELGRWRDRFTDPRPYFVPSPPVAGCSSVLRVAFRYQRERHTRGERLRAFRPLPTSSRVLLLRHGVVVGKRNLGISEPIAVDVYLNSDQVRSDLSGLAVEVQPEHVQAARQELRGLGGFLTVLESRLEAHVCRPRPSEVVGYTGLSALALLLTPWPIKLLTLGGSAFQLHAASQQYRRLVRDCTDQVRLFHQRHCQSSSPLPIG
jgi:hypothetical protein